ncbi:thioredoxin fold domain-containing protein [Chitinophaga oryziterrae]|uniref:Thioredoxin fold domain-containing protein n=1 Tax=Chitinophaga oryziterrae TaxID=1031224 RepID=A0A6N8J7E0_9BACT|nr:thioredoxin family protein [Chitinophaga oryziterrae]MVT40196.1 thioredoxin fold domain-containing protein [Chitinophaga oryziterrae]
MELLIITAITLVFSSCSHPVETNLITGKEGKSLSSFDLLRPNSMTIYHTSQMKGKPTVIFFFEPNCPYCQRQMEEIKTNMVEMDNMQFVLLTGAWFVGMNNFVERNGLKEYSDVVVGLDTANFFMKYYKLNGYPFSAFYNSKGISEYPEGYLDGPKTELKLFREIRGNPKTLDQSREISINHKIIHYETRKIHARCYRSFSNCWWCLCFKSKQRFFPVLFDYHKYNWDFTYKLDNDKCTWHHYLLYTCSRRTYH